MQKHWVKIERTFHNFESDFTIYQHDLLQSSVLLLVTLNQQQHSLTWFKRFSRPRPKVPCC